MRYLLLIAMLLLVCLPVAAQANKTVTFTWDAIDPTVLPDVRSIRLYTISGSTYTQVGEALCSGTPNVCPATITVTLQIPGTYRFVARFYDGLQDGPDSNAVISPVGPPGHLRK